MRSPCSDPSGRTRGDGGRAAAAPSAVRRGALRAALTLAVLGAWGCARGHQPPAGEVRLGYFPNLTHAQALIGVARGDFERALAPLRLKTHVFNAGPQAMEAMFAGELDLAYVGSGPAINAYARSRGQALRVIAGAASGGAALVVRAASGILGPGQMAGRKLATPQIGNTQDIMLRAYLKENGLRPHDQGGSVQVVPMANSDILSLMRRGEIDGAWVPEPWVTRLVRESDGRVLIDERDLWPQRRFATAVVVVSQAFLGRHPERVRKFLQSHVDLTLWIRDNPQEAQRQVNAELGKILGKPLPDEVLREAFSRLEVTYDPIQDSLRRSAERAFELGFLGRKRHDREGQVDLCLLDDVLAERKLETIGGGAATHEHGPARR